MNSTNRAKSVSKIFKKNEAASIDLARGIFCEEKTSARNENANKNAKSARTKSAENGASENEDERMHRV